MILLDQIGQAVHAPTPPQRIISLVPSITEMLVDLGLEEQLIGITKFCIHPHHIYKSKTRIGGTKQLHLDKIHALRPDLIIANQEENDREQVETLMKDYPVFVTKVIDIPSALEMIELLGQITGRSQPADAMVQDIKVSWNTLLPLSAPPKVLYLIWHNPMMSIGNDTFIYAMLAKAGFESILPDQARYPVIDPGDVKELKPDFVFLSSEPFPFREKHLIHYQRLFPTATIELVDGELFSWYGSRMRLAVDYFLRLRQKLRL